MLTITIFMDVSEAISIFSKNYVKNYMISDIKKHIKKENK